MRRGGDIGIGFLFLLWAMSRKGAAGDSPGSLVVVTRKPTGGNNWKADRLAALQAEGVTGDMAIAVVTQWALETANGRAEWNWNVGNRVATGRDRAFFLDPGEGNPRWYKAYDSLADGVADYLALLRGSFRYVECWRALEGDPTSDTWIRCLGHAGYYTADVDTYAAGYMTRKGQLFPTPRS